MKQWHCFIGDQQYGPIDEYVLRRWIQEGRVGPDDRVWTEGMANWERMETIPSLLSARSVVPSNSMVPAAAPAGTGGLTPNVDLMSRAREALRGQWRLPISFALLMGLIHMGISALPRGLRGVTSMILTGPLMLGAVIFYLSFSRSQLGELGMLFAGFKNFGKAIGAHLLIGILVIGWFLLFASVGIILLIIAAANDASNDLLVGLGVLGMMPGVVAVIVAQLAYSQTFYLIASDRTTGPLAAIRQSEKLMMGFKTKLVWLQIRFSLWFIACILFTLGIGLLWVIPYMGVAFACFFDDLRRGEVALEQVPSAPPQPPVTSLPTADLGPTIYTPQ